MLNFDRALRVRAFVLVPVMFGLTRSVVLVLTMQVHVMSVVSNSFVLMIHPKVHVT